jgi:hypothetical protein
MDSMLPLTGKDGGDHTADRAGVMWRTSSRCGANGPCVQFAELPGGVGLRDSKDPGGPVLRFTPEEWRAFTAGVIAGEFDV